MTLTEFSNEFDIMYNTASYGAPDLNNYEKSLFLTQAVRDLIDELYPQYEYSEANKRALAPLVTTYEFDSNTEVNNYFSNVTSYEYTLPAPLYYILRENVTIEDQCNDVVEVVPTDLDALNKALKNPFKKPSKRKVLRTTGADGLINLYCSDSNPVTAFKITYLTKYSPIILSDFEDDSELVGDETIDGLNVETSTELPVFLHDKIVKRGVVLAIASLRQNNLETKTKI